MLNEIIHYFIIAILICISRSCRLLDIVVNEGIILNIENFKSRIVALTGFVCDFTVMFGVLDCDG